MPPTTDAHTYRPADTVRPSRSMACVSTEKVEKVVNAPRNPAPSDTVTTSDHHRRSPARSKKPRAKDPTRLMPSVVHGKSLDVHADPRPSRARAPAAPATAKDGRAAGRERVGQNGKN